MPRPYAPGVTSTGLPTTIPAVATSASLEVVDANRMWEVLHSPLAPVRNLARAVFTHPASRGFWPDLEREQYAVVAALRFAALRSRSADEALRLARELSAADPVFRRLWARTRVSPRLRARVLIRHPALGPLTFHRITTVSGPHLTHVYRPAGGQAAADSVALLALL